MSEKNSQGFKFRVAVENNSPLQVVGVVTAYYAIMAEKCSHKALYLSGGGLAACSLGVPDLGITTLNDLIEDASRITAASSLPLLVDVDTGFGSAFNIARTVKELIRIDVAAMHMEDQVSAKRCGHRPNKAIVSESEMVDRIKAACDARTDENFVIMARTDALAVEGIEKAIERSIRYVEAGADMLFPEAVTKLDQYKKFSEAVNVPILANITEFGSTPLFTTDELKSADVKIALYPLTAFRAMSKAALTVYQTLLSSGTQKDIIDTMQTRMELYDTLGYMEFEKKLDNLFQKEAKEKNE
ncbi:MAG: methylisocitrate lyase [Nitrospinota bacterium]